MPRTWVLVSIAEPPVFLADRAIDPLTAVTSDLAKVHRFRTRHGALNIKRNFPHVARAYTVGELMPGGVVRRVKTYHRRPRAVTRKPPQPQ